ncbi:SnoaL-like polyketide cyclase [Purpureocillium lavendulum]|uniref:SnoaL-like polyketide cyclase n=1 Tax=Purpureocillium lavendulum TaxID=1247861 RepID=A0AB34FJV7_9HYPO|nr:SnoaL-like polyketide cyclase [Purpureocillium lavendulum]
MGRPQARNIVESWAAALARRDYSASRDILSPGCSVLRNGVSHDRDSFIAGLQTAIGSSPGRVEIGLVIVDSRDSSNLAARLIHHDEDSTGASGRTLEHAFLWIDPSGKIVKMVTVTDDTAPKEVVEDKMSEPTVHREGRPDAGDLAGFYEEYIGTINSLTMKERLHEFCQPTVTHNARRFSLDEYRLMIESSFDEIRGLHFAIDDLFVDSETGQIAARLGFTGRPAKEFRGIAPTGKDVRFSEHAYYRLEDGKIARVQSLLDLASYKRSLVDGDA